jgi:hypothetical protein
MVLRLKTRESRSSPGLPRAPESSGGKSRRIEIPLFMIISFTTSGFTNTNAKSRRRFIPRRLFCVHNLGLVMPALVAGTRKFLI